MIIIGIGVTALFSYNCKEKVIGPTEKSLYTSELKGQVSLQNQSEHSNALVYLDSLDRGFATDSNAITPYFFRKLIPCMMEYLRYFIL